MDSTPASSSSRIASRAFVSSSGRRTRPRASIRSGTPRVCSRSASGSGFFMIIQPARGPGVCERARWSTCSKFSVTSSPTFAPFSSSTMLVETVVPCSTVRMSPGRTLARSSRAVVPSMIPTDWSSGVEGVFRSWMSPLRSSRSRRSVKVPPTSMPSRALIRGRPSTTRAASRAASARGCAAGPELRRRSGEKPGPCREPGRPVDGGRVRRRAGPASVHAPPVHAAASSRVSPRLVRQGDPDTGPPSVRGTSCLAREIRLRLRRPIRVDSRQNTSRRLSGNIP